MPKLPTFLKKLVQMLNVFYPWFRMHLWRKLFPGGRMATVFKSISPANSQILCSLTILNTIIWLLLWGSSICTGSIGRKILINMRTPTQTLREETPTPFALLRERRKWDTRATVTVPSRLITVQKWKKVAVSKNLLKSVKNWRKLM